MSDKENNKPRFECRNAMYFKAKDGSQDDMVLVKEYVHMPDGTRKQNLRIIENYEKPVYVHKEGYRKYKTKQVWKPKSEMQVYRTTEAKLGDTIKKALGMPLGIWKSNRELCRSPYIYGSDIDITAYVRKRYKDTWPLTVSRASVAVLDIETSVLPENYGEIIALALSFKDKAIVATTKKFVGTTPLIEKRFYEKLDELTPEVRNDRKCNVEFVIADTPALAIIEVMKRAHEWKPDFITGWNLMDFDIPKILNTLENEHFMASDVLSDPSIPYKYRHCRYVQGTKIKKTASDKSMPLAGYEQWHWLDVPASFFFIDSMCVFFQIRKGATLEENYKLDTILNKYIGRGKVGIKEADHLDGVDKHRFMQEQHKAEYLVYNLFDCIGVEILDETTKDLCSTIGTLAGISGYTYYTSNPRLLVDALNFYVQESPDFNGVLGTASDQLKTKLDEYVPSLSGWVVALATERLIPLGLDNIKEIPGLETKMHAHSADIDITSGYPNIERAMNLSKDTTMHELNAIEGLTFDEQRIIGLNMLGGYSNSMSFANNVYRLPSAETMYEHYLSTLQ